MNPLLKKEIRLLLPAWTLTMLLALLAAYAFRPYNVPRDVFGGFLPVWLGIMVLCASSFGREFSLGTFSSFLAQPVPRQRYWWTKVGVLTAALISVLAVFGVCTVPGTVGAMEWGDLAMFLVWLLAAVAGGLWLALLVRQLMAVIWLVALVPGVLCLPFLLVLSHFDAEDKTMEVALGVVVLLYAVAGIAGSWVTFRRAQDAPWSGGTLALPAWLTRERMPHAGMAARQFMPWRALIRKEFHFNQVLLLGMAALFLLDLGAVGVRFLRRTATGDFNQGLEVLGIVIWVLVPLIIGCTSIAEERKLGMLEGQLCQPVSTRRQYLIKLVFSVTVGGVLSTLCPLLAEILASSLGLKVDGPAAGEIPFLMLGMCALALIGFFASSLTRNLLQALPVAICLIVGIFAVAACFANLGGYHRWPPQDFILWNPLLPDLILSVLLPLSVVWLAWRNFQSLHEVRRIWWRNGLGIGAVLLVTTAASLLVYHRTWERFTAVEPPHGTPYWTAAARPSVVRTGLPSNLLIAQPNGQYWLGSLQPPAETRSALSEYIAALLPGLRTPRLELSRAIPGTGWQSLVAGYVDLWLEARKEDNTPDNAPPEHIVEGRETVGIKTDGTLWVSEKPGGRDWNTNALVQFGTETNWQEVLGTRSLSSVLLLKTDGTLWRWGEVFSNTYLLPPGWSGLRTQTPRQIDAGAKWQALFNGDWTSLAQREDGSVWYVGYDAKKHADELVINTNYAPMETAGQRLDSTKLSSGGVPAGIRGDGTLWIWGDHLYWNSKRQFELLQSGGETNWTAVAQGQGTMVALKSDGTLWRWGSWPYIQSLGDAFTGPPARLGIHNDWVALTQTWNGVVSLAADGSLWLWPNGGQFFGGNSILIEPSEKPVLLGNILATK